MVQIIFRKRILLNFLMIVVVIIKLLLEQNKFLEWYKQLYNMLFQKKMLQLLDFQEILQKWKPLKVIIPRISISINLLLLQIKLN